MVKEKGGKVVCKTISLKIDTFSEIAKYTNRYFQGNLSASIGYMCLKYLESEEQLKALLTLASNSESVTKEKKESPKEEEFCKITSVANNIDIFNNM